MAVEERTVTTSTSTDPKLEMTDSRGLNDLNKAFDKAFGPREGGGGQKPDQSVPLDKPAKRETRQDASGSRETSPAGHHAPVEVKPSEKPPSEPDAPLNLLGVPEYRAKPREHKELSFDDDIPTQTEEEKKTTAFPGRDSKTGKFTRGTTTRTQPAEETETGETADEEDPDPEVDAVQAKASAHPNVKEGIQRLKTIAKARRSEIKSLTAASEKLKGELSEIKKNGLPPDVKTELDKLRAVSSKFDLLNDDDFKQKYEDPIEAAGDRLCQFCIDLSNGHPDLKKWADSTKAFGYKNVAVDYWDKEIIPKIESVTNQQRVAQLAAELHSKIDARNRMVTDFTASPDKVQEYKQQQAIEYFTRYQQEAQAESDTLVSQIGDWAKLRDLNKAKSDEERALFEEHNKRTDGYKTLFEKTMGDLIHGGPRKHVRVAAMAVYGMELDRQLKEALADLESLQSDYDALKTQYSRVTRSRSIPGRTGGADAPPKPNGAISTGDARAALKEYFGGAGT